jgi:transcriptional regulator
VTDHAQLLPGTLDLRILQAVSLGPLHGYGILLRIGQISGNALLIEQGALYPGVFRLVRQGMLKASWGTSENNRRAKFYELTAAGRERLREETDNRNRLVTAIASARVVDRSHDAAARGVNCPDCATWLRATLVRFFT